MQPAYPHLNVLWGDLIIEELVRCGADRFFISPGSRSSPLTVAVARHPGTQAQIHFDERGSAFCALGYARATGRPAVVITTSGTAVANLFPAVVEASMDEVPLILLTADRPPELRGTGANQTIDQVNMFGTYARWFVDLPCPDENIDPSYVVATVDQAVRFSTDPAAGPVHVNCMFREPLAPTGEARQFTAYLSGLKQWAGNEKPYTRFSEHPPAIAGDFLDQVVALIEKTHKGILVVGILRNGAQREAVRRLISELHWPVFPDIASGLRTGISDLHVVAHYDHLLHSDEVLNWIAPDAVLQIGGVPTSKRLLQFLVRLSPEHYLQVPGFSRQQDPIRRVTLRIDAPIVDFCSHLSGQSMPDAVDSTWRDSLTDLSRTVATLLSKSLDDNAPVSEPLAARLVSQHISPESGLWLAGSMPIRDMDMFADPGGPPVVVGCNRGASGIDGAVASAAGFAQGLDRPVTLLVGDLALLHDLNSLALLSLLPQPVTIVVLNNNGGGIFSFLPIAEATDVFERFFGTPHGLTFQAAAEMFNLEYSSPTTGAEFVEAYRQSQAVDQSTIIEIKTDRRENVQLHREIEQRIASALRGV